jgi:SOS-response transcriptional repressor LexA
MIGLTKQQSRALTVIRAHHAQWGRVPSMRQLARLLELATTSRVHEVITALTERGYLTKDTGGRDARYRLNHDPIPSDPLSHGWRFIPVEDLPAARAAA